MGRIICELERIYGVRQGSNNLKGINVTEHCAVTQKDLADKLSVDERSYANYKKLTTLIPELQEMVNSGINQPTTIGGFPNPLTPFARCVKFNLSQI